MFFFLFIIKNFLINSIKYGFFLFFKTKTVFQNSVSKHNFFFLQKTQKTALKNYFSE